VADHDPDDPRAGDGQQAEQDAAADAHGEEPGLLADGVTQDP